MLHCSNWQKIWYCSWIEKPLNPVTRYINLYQFLAFWSAGEGKDNGFFWPFGHWSPYSDSPEPDLHQLAVIDVIGSNKVDRNDCKTSYLGTKEFICFRSWRHRVIVRYTFLIFFELFQLFDSVPTKEEVGIILMSFCSLDTILLSLSLSVIREGCASSTTEVWSASFFQISAWSLSFLSFVHYFLLAWLLALPFVFDDTYT